MAVSSDAQSQEALDGTLRAAVAPTASLVGLGYLISGMVHLGVGDVDRDIVAPLELFSSVVLFSVSLWLRGSRKAPGTLYLVATFVAASILLNNFAFLMHHAEAEHPFVLYLLILGAGLLSALPSANYVSILAGTVGVIGVVSYRSPDPWTSWVEIGTVLVAMLAMAQMLRVWTRAHFTRVHALEAEAAANHEARDAIMRRYRDLTDSASEMIAELDDRGIVLYANPAHREIFGYSPADLVGVDIRRMLGVAVDVNDPSGADYGRLLAEPTGPTEIEATRADGHRRVIEMTSRPFRTPKGERRVVVISRDVTQRAGLEAERFRYREELEALVEERTRALSQSMVALQRRERLASVGTLAAGIAHQINNPVGGILLSAQFALGKEAYSEFRHTRDEEGSSAGTSVDATEIVEMQRALRTIVSEAERCGEIVRNLLRLARDESTESGLLDLRELVLRVTDLCRPYAVSRGASLSCSDSGAVFEVVGNAVELEAAFINLIRNAVEARESAVRVEVEVLARKDALLVEVRDDGEGMESAVADRIFDPFYTTKLHAGGTGLGLSVAHAIAEDHGGSLTAESKPGEGTVIRMRLPRSANRAAPVSALRP